MTFTISLLMLCQVHFGYNAAHAEAVRLQRPMIVGVGCAAPAGDWIATYTKSLEGFAVPCVVVSVPRDGYMEWLKTLPPTASAAEIQRALANAPRRVSLNNWQSFTPRASAQSC